uniref:Ubiquitin-conjugating enzyme E2 Q2 n=1 Tax=Aceria tosichella TaxID=561515 RepID=A0A6G1SAX2_9ACAR
MLFIKSLRTAGSLIVAIAIVFVLTQVALARDIKRGSALAAKRLMQEYRDVLESDSYKNGVFTVELVNDNIFEWHVKLYKLDADSRLYSELQELKAKGGRDHILMQLEYDAEYPFKPPFLRVVYPFIAGHCTIYGGFICAEVLTEKGWSSSYTIEPLILQLAAALSADGYIADPNGVFSYETARSLYEVAMLKKDLFTIEYDS